MDFKKLPLACTVFDTAARQHGPMFFAPSLPVMWRNVDNLLKEHQELKGEFVVYVHGYFDTTEVRLAFQPFMEPMTFSASDRRMLSLDQVQFVIESVELSFAAGGERVEAPSSDWSRHAGA